MALLIISLSMLLIFLVSVLVLARQTRSDPGSVYNLPPGPKKLPIIGNLHKLGAAPHRSLFSLSQKYGPLMYLQLGSVPTVVVSSPAMAKSVLKTHDLDFCSRPSLLAAGKFTYGCLDMAFAPFGEYWKEMKKICTHELFSPKRVQSFRTVREEEVELMIKSISDSSSSPVNLSKLLMSLSNNIICRIAMNMTCQGGGYGKSKFHRILIEEEELIVSFCFTDYFPALGWLDRVNGKLSKIEKTHAEFDEFFEEVIEEHLDPRRSRPENEDLVDVLLKLQKEANLTRDHIKAILTDIFVAGTQTASTGLTWTMTELMRNPNAMAKAQDEVRSIIGSKGKVEEDDLPRLRYLKCVLKEAMRVHPPNPLLLPHESMKQCKINGYDILPKTRVFINVWALGKDPSSWENPEEFNPDRFMGSSVDMLGQDFALLPFGSGRRMCPAMNLGILTMELALANLLYMFDWKLPGRMKIDEIDMTEAPGLAAHKKTHLLLMAAKYVPLSTP